MLKYMTLIRGDSEVTYPIYQISDLTKMSQAFAITTSDSIKAIAYGCNPTISPDGVQAAFADEIPTTAADFGNITQNNMQFVLDTATRLQYCPDAHFVIVPVGTKPDDWDTNYFDYFTYQTGQVGNWGNVPSPVYPATDPRQIPEWSSTTQFYKSDTPTLQERFNHLFFTKAGYSVGIWSMSGQGEGDGAYRHKSYIACNPRSEVIMDDLYSYVWRDQNGNFLTHTGLSRAQWYAYWRTNCMDITTPAAGAAVDTTPLTSDRRDMQLFCWLEYNNEIYYGVIAIAIDSNGALTNARLLAFTRGFWGDSVSDEPPTPGPQEGEWGPESGRAGGDGGFDDTSDNRGDLTGAAIAISIAQQAQVVNRNLQAGGFHVYRLADGTMEQISRVLFSQSYFGLLTVSRYNPLSAILSYHLLPSVFVPLTYNGSAQTAAVKAGGYNFNTDPDTPVQVPVQSIIDTVSHWHVGSVDLAPYFGAFPDFAPFTAVKLHLPYVGEIMIDTNKVQHGSLAVDYTCDVLNGNVCAFVTCVDRAGHTEQVYTATGNAAYSLPIFSETQSGAAVGKLISAGVMSAVTGNAAGMLGTAAAALDAAAFGVQHSPQVHGSFGGNVGMIGDTVCWLEIIRPQWVEPANFQQLHGIPSGIAGTLESTGASGFVQLQSIEVDDIEGATEQELEEIVKTLKAGIYIGGVEP